MSSRLDDIRARAMVETDGFFASDGREVAKPVHVPHVTTYFKACPEKIAASPATLVERADVLWLCDQHAELYSALVDAAKFLADTEYSDEAYAALQICQAALAKARGEAVPS